MCVEAVSVGLPALRLRHGLEVLTGGDKSPVAGAMLLPSGFAGDGQADGANHGGPDKAVCLFPADHYPYWAQLLQCDLEPGAFSENLTVRGALETVVCIGDIFRCGEALVQVCQPRKPCSKLAGKHGEPRLVKWVADAGYTGYYLRVLAPGQVATGDPFILVRAHPAHITVAAVNDLIYERSLDLPLVAQLAELEVFGAWGRALMAKRLAMLS